MTFFIIDFSEFWVFSAVIFCLRTNILNGFCSEGGHIQFTIIISLAVCAQKQEVNETDVDSWR
jgi:hypothetical protein